MQLAINGMLLDFDGFDIMGDMSQQTMAAFQGAVGKAISAPQSEVFGRNSLGGEFENSCISPARTRRIMPAASVDHLQSSVSHPGNEVSREPIKKDGA